jgi:tripartite-type tricarboxylate transporter receptor subunit TctC
MLAFAIAPIYLTEMRMSNPPNSCTALAVFAITTMGSCLAVAQSYPTKPIRAVVPYAAGGFSDIVSRMLSERLSRELGQTLVIDARPGGGGRIGAEAVARATPDGYTLLITTNGTHSYMPVTEEKLSYDPIKDFTPISFVGSYGLLMVVTPSLPARNVAELVDYAKKNPGKLNYATSGLGSGIHFAGELFKSLAGVDITHVPYKGSAPAMQDTMAGVVQITFDGAAKPMIDAGKVRLLGTTMARRDPRFPQQPTIGEAGLPGYDLTYWVGVFGPAGLAPAILQRLNSAFNTALADPDLRKRLTDMGIIIGGGAPEIVEQTIKSDIAQLSKIARDTKLQVK